MKIYIICVHMTAYCRAELGGVWWWCGRGWPHPPHLHGACIQFIWKQTRKFGALSCTGYTRSPLQGHSRATAKSHFWPERAVGPGAPAEHVISTSNCACVNTHTICIGRMFGLFQWICCALNLSWPLKRMLNRNPFNSIYVESFSASFRAFD